MSPTVLIVEDNPDSQDMIARILRHYNIDSAHVASAEEALESLEQSVYDGLVVDLALPAMDGWTLIEYLHSNPRTAHLKCVAVTAYHSRELAAQALQAGFEAFFPKPLDKAVFAERVRQMVNG